MAKNVGRYAGRQKSAMQKSAMLVNGFIMTSSFSCCVDSGEGCMESSTARGQATGATGGTGEVSMCVSQAKEEVGRKKSSYLVILLNR